MSWNHRILAHKQKDNSIWYEIHEVYYDQNGKPNSYTSIETPVAVAGDTIEGIKWTLDKMKECLSKPVLWAGDRFPEIVEQENFT